MFECILVFAIAGVPALLVKTSADSCKNTIRFERSVLAGMLNCCWSSNSPGNFSHSLLGRTVKVGNGVWSSSMMMIFGCHVEVGDIVRHCDSCGIVQACLLIDAVLYAAVEIMEKDGDHSAPWGLWNSQGTTVAGLQVTWGTWLLGRGIAYLQGIRSVF